MPFGAHMSIAGGVSKAFARGEHIGCDTMQIFCKNDRQWSARPYSPEEIAAYKAEQERTGIRPVVVHASYLINMAAPAEDLWSRSIAGLVDELERCALLDIPYLVVHPGAHVGSGVEAGIQRIAEALDQIFHDGVGDRTMVLLETTAGQGTALGWRFEEIAQIIEHVATPERLGVCIDTCHLFAAGYDLRTAETYAATFTNFDRIIGLDHLKVIHLNDSARELGSRVDRHEHIGKGQIGQEGFRFLVNDPRLRALPMILETPKGKDMAEDVENLGLLRSLVDPSLAQHEQRAVI